jgi:(p)ppGpp synthase/HD superfamily hydrolase
MSAERKEIGPVVEVEEVPAVPVSPPWIADSPLLERAYTLAKFAHRAQRRPADGRPFLDHVMEDAGFLNEAGFDEALVAAGLLHDAVERGVLSEEELRTEMEERVSSLVLDLSEDVAIESFEERKVALRRQVEAAGGRALTVFAADKLSDIVGLRRGIQESGSRAVERRIGTRVASMADHYRESVELIEAARPGSAFLPALRVQLDGLVAEAMEVAAREAQAEP